MKARAARGEVVIRAPAKINLGLLVLGRRPDGYHEIVTLFQAVSLFDSLRLRRRRRGIILRCAAFAGREEENLACRAAEVLLAEGGLDGGLEIELDKRIPVGGGMGGGSSDAAAVLLGGCRLFGIRPPMERLCRWAASLGSDVPFFLFSGAAVGRGRGEVIEPLDNSPPRGAVLLYNRGFESSTAAVYGALGDRLTRGERRHTILLKRWAEGDPEALGEALFNDLEKPFLERHPELAGVPGLLRDAGATGAQVSGSGASLFGIFPTAEAASDAARQLRASLPGRLKVARFLPSRHHWGVVKR